MDRHRLSPPQRLTYPGGKDGMWVVRCSCGYSTACYPTEASARKPARAHLGAMVLLGQQPTDPNIRTVIDMSTEFTRFTADGLSEILDDIAARVYAGDSLEGHIEYRACPDGWIEARGSYRVGLLDGHNGMRIVGTVAGPKRGSVLRAAQNHHALPAFRRFRLVRDIDVTGVSGTGHVADGLTFPDGVTVVRWHGPRPSTVMWSCIEHAVAVHGHDGKTRIEWLDPAPQETADADL